MSRILLAFSVACAVGAGGAETKIFFRLGGADVARLSLRQIRAKVPPVAIAVHEPHEAKDVTYRGIPTVALLDAVLGPGWREREELLFTCADGYQPSIPVSEVLARESVLSFERVGEKRFGLVNRLQGGEEVALGPLYLVWNNKKHPELLKSGATGWPYQVVGVDAYTYLERFGAMAPPDSAGEEAKRGFQAFRKHCFTCHTVNGAGGLKNVELNYPVSVTELFKEEWLLKWILDPSSIRWKTKMPTLEVENKEQVAREIVAYLKVMAGNKKQPKD